MPESTARQRRQQAQARRMKLLKANPYLYKREMTKRYAYSAKRRAMPECYRRQLACQRRHYQRHKEEVKRRVAAYRHKHIEERRAYNREYYRGYQRALKAGCDIATAREQARHAAKEAFKAERANQSGRG